MNSGKQERQTARDLPVRPGAYPRADEPVRFRKRFDEAALLNEMSVPCLMRVAENTSVPPGLLDQLAVHPHADVREAVADNPATPLDTLWLLAHDYCVDVRFAMAENHNLPLSLLSALSEDDNPYVSQRALMTIERLSHSGTICRLTLAQKAG